ncbi:hypothetical protein [Actinokineospora sp. NPDC004072]
MDSSRGAGGDRMLVAAVVVDDGAGGELPADRCAAAIERWGGLAARVVDLDLGGPLREDLWARIAESDAVFLPGARPGDAERIRDLLGVPVLTWRDTAAAVLVAQALTTLTRLGHPPGLSRVVVAGADAMPVVTPLLLAASIHDITVWNPADAAVFPLRDIAVDAHVVLDLGALWPWTGPADRDPVVITARSDHDPLIALPGLLRALAGTPGAQPHVPVLHACVLALVMATGADHHLPRIAAGELADRIADAATAVLRAPSRRVDG